MSLSSAARRNGDRAAIRRIYPLEDLCMGCGLCEVHCLVEHSRTRDVIKAYLRERPAPLARLRVERRDNLFLPVQCRHCPEPLCVYSCLTGALSRDPTTGEVHVDAARCIGCWTCILACPYGAIRRDLQRGIISKCDLCPDRSLPACVAACPNEAILYVEEAL
jgi:carbon-monoxide dehydrogenase iron sulfur subunit